MFRSIKVLLSLSIASSIILTILLSCANEEGTTSVPVPEEFTGDERAVMKELFTIWERPGHLGSLDQAADRAGVELDDSMRHSILTKMEGKLMMHDFVARYRPYTFVMTNDEKRIAAFITHYEHMHEEFPPIDTVAAHVNMSPEEVRERLRFLSKVQMFYDLGEPDEYNPLGFSYGSKLASFTFDLGTHIHAMRIGASPEINAGCSKEALYVVYQEYPDSHLVYNSYDPVSLEPIAIEFDDATVTSVSPEGAVIFEGGTCGTNNFFASRANAEQWATSRPQWQNTQLPIYPVASRLEQLKQEQPEGE